MGRLCTVDLLIKKDCFVKNVLFASSKAVHLKEVNCAEPSPSVKIP
jgi:hypothetical protein